MNILAFGASYSRKSINRQFADYTARQFPGNDLRVLDLNDFDLPVFTVDLEEELGYPEIISDFIECLNWADFLIISLAEHNGAYTAAFKNLFDWTSRLKMDMFANKPVLLLSTSTGKRGGQSVLQIAENRFPRHGANILASFSLPSFNEHFKWDEGIIHPQLHQDYQRVISKVKEILNLDK